MNEDIFFQNYNKVHKASVGIPGVDMNAPLVPNRVKGKVGLELEIEGRNLRMGAGAFEGVQGPKSRATWLTLEDGSLRNGGREFVLNEPIFVDEIDGMLEGLFKQIDLYKGVIENSNRCSTHVHVNVGGKKINEITSAIALWYMFETAAIAWCGEERVSNHFCLSNMDSPSTMNAWSTYLRTGRRPVADGLKYAALNVLPIWRFGSLEFRCGQAAHEPTRPAQWAKFVAALVDYAGDTFPNPEMIAAAVSETGANSILQNICDKAGLSQEFYGEMIGNTADFEGDCLRSLRNCQSIVLGVPWSEWMPVIERDYVPNPFNSKKKVSREVPFPEPALNGEWAQVLGGRREVREVRLRRPDEVPPMRWDGPAPFGPARAPDPTARDEELVTPNAFRGDSPRNWRRGDDIPIQLYQMNATRVPQIIAETDVSVNRAVELERIERERSYRMWSVTNRPDRLVAQVEGE